MARFRLLHLEETDSTNAYLRRLRPQEDTAVYADSQTAGRGQRGNTWCSAPGENLLFSAVWHPHSLPARCQFSVSEAAAIAVVALLEEHGVEAKVKWPNDIYVGDEKICGILIENAVGASLLSAIIGIGLNLNQTSFPETLPNPVSLRRLTGLRYEPAAVAQRLTELLCEYLPQAETAEGRRRLHSRFLSRLYRADGRKHRFYDALRREEIEARVTGVAEDGYLSLQVEGEPQPRRFAFKEVVFRY